MYIVHCKYINNKNGKSVRTFLLLLTNSDNTKIVIRTQSLVLGKLDKFSPE